MLYTLHNKPKCFVLHCILTPTLDSLRSWIMLYKISACKTLELQTYVSMTTYVLSELYNVADEQLESSEELPSLTRDRYMHGKGDNQETDNDELPICTGDQYRKERRYKNQDTFVQLPLITGNQCSTKEGGDNQQDTVPVELPTFAIAKNHKNAKRKYNNQDTENEELCPLVMNRYCILPATLNRNSTSNVLYNHKNNENDTSDLIDDEFIEHTDSSSSLEQFDVNSFSNQDMTMQTLSPGYTRLHSNSSFTEKSHLKPRYSDLSNVSQSNISESNVDHLSEVIDSRRPKGDNPDYNNSGRKGRRMQNESNRENCCYIDMMYDHTDNTEQQNSNQSCKETDCSHSNVDNLTEIEIDMLCHNQSKFNVEATTQDKYTETDNSFDLDLITQDTVSINHYRTDILKSDLDEKIEVRAPFKNSTMSSEKSNLLNLDLDIMSEVSEFGSGINLISTQEADLELENFSIDNDSQLDL